MIKTNFFLICLIKIYIKRSWKIELYIACDFETAKSFENDYQKSKTIAFSCSAIFEKKRNEEIKLNLEDIKKLNLEKYFDFGGENVINNFFTYLFKFKKYSKINIFFHNFKNFDAYFLLPYLLENFEQKMVEEELVNNSFHLLFLNSFLLNIKIKFNNCVFNFLDSLAFFPKTSLKNFGEIIGLEKLETDFETNLEKKLTKKYLDFRKYTQRDSKILSKFLYYFMTKNQINLAVAISIAGISFRVFKEKYKNKGLYIFNKFNWNLINKSYFGGFTYLNSKKELKIIKNLNYYDINSAYPYILSKKVPFGEIVEFKSQKWKSAEKIYWIRIKKLKINEYDIGIIRIKGKNEFLKNFEGDLEYVLWEFELDFVYKFYKIFEFEIINIYIIKTKKFVDKFIDFWYSKKQKTSAKKTVEEKMENIFAKLVLNSLYGKFGESILKSQKIYSKTNLLNYNIIEKNSKEYEIIRENKNLLYKNFRLFELKELEPRTKKFKNIAIASFVTAKIRTILYSKILKDPKNFVYCDTDSIFFENTKLDFKELGVELGKWKIEKEGISGYFVKNKQYFLDIQNNIEFKLAGFTKTHEELLDLEKIAKNPIRFQKLSSKKTAFGVILEEKTSKLIGKKWEKE